MNVAGTGRGAEPGAGLPSVPTGNALSGSAPARISRCWAEGGLGLGRGGLGPRPAVVPCCGAEYAALDPVLAEYVAAPMGSGCREQARRQLITGLLPVVKHLARRFARREPLADLVQAGVVGLIQAIDRYDPARRVPLLGYAIPTIYGEIQHHLRGPARPIRIPQRLHELRPRYYRATTELSQTLRRAPWSSEIAAHLGLDRAQMVEFLRAEHEARNLLELDRPPSGEIETTLAERIADPTAPIERFIDAHALHSVLARLPARERNPDPAAVLRRADPGRNRCQHRGVPDARVPVARPDPGHPA